MGMPLLRMRMGAERRYLVNDDNEEEERDLYGDDIGPDEAYAEYTVFIPCGDAETRFREFIASIPAAESQWKDRYWV